MSEDKKPGLPPITLPKGQRIEGTLFNVPVKRITKPSAFLKSLQPKKKKRTLQEKYEANVAFGRFIKGGK